MILIPDTRPPFALAWGFTTRHTPTHQLPEVRLTQVHGCTVHPASPGPWQRQEGDGLWTQTPGLTLGVRVADCVPVLLAGATPSGPWVAALHAGWKGIVGGMLRRGVEIFCELGGRPAELHHAFGPAIGPCHFEVGPEVVALAQRDPDWDEALALPGEGDRSFLDLHGLLQAQARSLGLCPERDGSIRRCTRCEPDTFFSFRGGDTEARQWGFVRLLPSP